MSDTYRGADYDQDEAEEARKKIVKNAHKLLDRAEQIIDHITKNGEENVDNDWKKVIIDGEEKLMRKVEMQSDLVEAIKAHKDAAKKEQDLTEEEKKRNEELANEWKKVTIDGKEKLMRKVEMQSDLVEAIKAHKTANTEKQDLIEEEKKRNEETKVVPQDGFFEFKK